MKKAPSPSEYYEIAENVFWVGHYLPNDSFQCHVYLIRNGENSVLIDPGSMLTLHYSLKKIEKIVPFTNIRWFICHHQDPDITGSLQLIDQMISRDDARIVSHWRCIALLKHYDLNMQFLDVEHNNWSLDIGGRKLKFLFSPYLHFPGAFCTYEEKSKILFSSDIFGGFTKGFQLYMTDRQQYFETIKPFHEHYMPSQDILHHFLSKLENYDIDLITSQHGSIITKEFIPFVIDQLKDLDCGLFLLTQTSSEVMKLSKLNDLLHSFLRTVVTRRSFADIAEDLLQEIQPILPVLSLSFYASNENNQIFFMSRNNKFQGLETYLPAELDNCIGLDSLQWKKNKGDNFIFIDKKNGQLQLVLPLIHSTAGNIQSFALMEFKEKVNLYSEIRQILTQLSIPLSVAVEREIALRTHGNGASAFLSKGDS